MFKNVDKRGQVRDAAAAENAEQGQNNQNAAPEVTLHLVKVMPSHPENLDVGEWHSRKFTQNW